MQNSVFRRLTHIRHADIVSSSNGAPMLEEYRRDYASFNTSLNRECYLFQSGLKSRLELGPIYERYSGLYGLDSICQLKRLHKECPPDSELERSSLHRLLAFAVEQFIAYSVRGLTEEISQYEARATIEWSANKLTFHDASVAINTEADRDLRRGLYDQRAGVIEASNDLRLRRIRGMHQAASTVIDSFDTLSAAGLSRSEPVPGVMTASASVAQSTKAAAPQARGSAAYPVLYEKLFQIEFDQLEGQVRQLLERTDRVYAATLDRSLINEIGISSGEAERHDALYFLHTTRYDDLFPVSDLVDVYERTMAGLGITVNTQRNIEIDSAPRARKTPRAFCAPITVPDEIKLVIRPTGGQTDYLTLLHEAGHAQHYGWTSPGLRPEFKYSGDYSLSETYAFLFNHLPCEPAWLGEFLSAVDTEELVTSLLLAKLVTVRRYAAKLIYERQLHSSEDPEKANSIYAETQTLATRFQTRGTEFLFDLDDSFYSTSYLRAWALEVLLRDYLKSKYGTRWWTSKRAGSFLREIWETGDRYSASEMASQIGVGPIDFDPLIEEFVTRLST